MSDQNRPQLSSAFLVFPTTRFANPDSKGEGEICMWGRNVMMGYLNRSDKNRDDFDDDGWFHSGDLGMEDSEGFVFVTGSDPVRDFRVRYGPALSI